VARFSSTKAVEILAPLTTKDAANRLPTLIRESFEGMAEKLATARADAGGGLLGRSFIFAVVLPTFLFWLYACFWQSERYVAETRLTVRAQHEKKSGTDAASMITKLTGGGANTSSQDAFMVLNYVKSRAIVADLGGRDYMEKKFARSGIDYFSRLGRNANAEEIWKYWLSHISASVDTLSGILTVRTDAFQPKDALDVARDIVRLSEDLVNKITVRNRTDALSRAELEVTLSRQMLADAREKTLQFRNKNVIIDPSSRATSIGELLGKLMMERMDIVNALSTFSSSLSSDAPSQRLQRTRLAAIDQQIADLKKKLTDPQGADAVSSQIASYERLKLDEQFAERLYSIAQTSYHHARQELAKQQLYLLTIVEPTLPESASYPKATANTILLFCALLVAWAAISLIVASIDDHMV
jgi:capsular polysaccharide transport system permease protein